MFAAYARNVYAPTKFVDVSFVFIKVGPDGTRVAADSSPETTVTAAGSGVYNITFPKAMAGYVVGAELAKTSSDGIFPENISFAPTSGTASFELSDEANLSGSEEIHITLALFNQ